MKKYKTSTRENYYDKVIDLYVNKKMGCVKISRIIPVSRSTITVWIRNFVSEHPDKRVMRYSEIILSDASNDKGSVKNPAEVSNAKESAAEDSNSKPTDVKALQDEISRLKQELAHESMRADAYNKMIELAEERFKISIRKKSGVKQ